MSDAKKKLTGIRHLPIFPLPLVMLPNELLPLHIFEDRYRQMLSDVEETDKLFGIVLFEPTEVFQDSPQIGTVGCIAEIRESETMPDGRSNLLSIGLTRFRLLSYLDDGNSYLSAEVEIFEDDSDSLDELGPIAEGVFLLFERMAKAAFKMAGNRGSMPEIQRADPEALSFLITAAFNFDNQKKYKFLEMTSTFERLSELKSVLDRAVGQIEESADIQAVSRTNGHSKKSIDL